MSMGTQKLKSKEFLTGARRKGYQSLLVCDSNSLGFATQYTKKKLSSNLKRQGNKAEKSITSVLCEQKNTPHTYQPRFQISNLTGR